jgi:hypothetical protein
MPGVALAVPHPGANDLTGLAPAAGSEKEGDRGAREPSENEEEDEIIAIVAHERQPFVVQRSSNREVVRVLLLRGQDLSYPAVMDQVSGVPDHLE